MKATTLDELRKPHPDQSRIDAATAALLRLGRLTDERLLEALKQQARERRSDRSEADASKGKRP